MLSLVRRMNFVFTLVLAALASDGVLHGQEGSERKPLSEAIAGLRKGGISDENLAQLDAIAQSDSPKAALARQIACLSRLQRGDYRSVWSVVSKLPAGSSSGSESLDWADQRVLVRELTATHSQKQQDHADAQRHLRGIELAKEQRSDPGSFKGIYRPSLYRSIDWGAESDRLLKELR